MSIQLKGGLGSQLFQIFSLMGIAEKNNYEYSIIKSNKSLKHNYFDNILSNVKNTRNTDDQDCEMFVVNENRFSQYTDITLDKDKMNNVYLKGLFQSFQYFDNIKDKVFDILLKEQKKDIMSTVNEYYNNLRTKHKNKKLVFVHARYFSEKDTYRKTLPTSYYLEAFKYFDDECVFVIFSDNQFETLNKFSNIKNTEYIVDEDYIELLLMSKMDGAIISNSLFSLWGAYLMDNCKCKTVVCPKYWYQEWDIHRLDYFHKHWKFVENTDMYSNVVVDPRK